MEKDTPSKTKRKSSTNWALSIGISLILTAIVLLIWFFLHGETTVTGNWETPQTSHSLVCETSAVAYPILKDLDADKTTLKVTAIFNNDKLDAISLAYKIYLSSSGKIGQATTSIHASMNKSFASSGLSADSLNATYNKLSDAAQLNLYATTQDLNSITAKYFMLNSLENSNDYTQDLVQNNYLNKGLSCTANN